MLKCVFLSKAYKTHDSSIQQPQKPELNYSLSLIRISFKITFVCFKVESNTATQENEQ